MTILPSWNEAVPLVVAVLAWEVLDVWPVDDAGKAYIGWRSRVFDLVNPGGRHGLELESASPFVDVSLT